MTERFLVLIVAIVPKINISVVFYEPVLTEFEFFHYRVIDDLERQT